MTNKNRAALLETLQRCPGASEAGIRSELRMTYGSSAALDDLLRDGLVVRRGHKIYRAEDVSR